MLEISVSIILGALISIAGIALTVLLCAWVYRDAQNKGMNGVLWTAVVFFVPSYIGLIIYLIIRIDNHKITCSKCNKKVNGKNKFCSNCGEELVPVVEVVDDEAFKKSQKKLLIGFFSTLAAMIICSIFMVATLLIGSVKLVGDAVEWVSELSTVQWDRTLEEALGDLDILFDADEIHVSAGEEKVIITDKDGNELINVDGNKETVDVNLQGFRDLFNQYNIQYDENMTDEELEKYIKEQIEKAIEQSVDLEESTEIETTEN